MGVNISSGAVLIGSGPSLRLIDCGKLSKFPTISFNRAWLSWEDWGFEPTWYACLDSQTLPLMKPDIERILAFRKVRNFFLNDIGRDSFPKNDRIKYFSTRTGNAFSENDGQLTDFGNVGATSLQVLWRRGFRKILMVGIDGAYHHFSEGEDDINHFRPDYNVGIPQGGLNRFVIGWPAALEECRRHKIDVRNCSPGSTISDCLQVEIEEGLEWLTNNDRE